MYALIEYDAAIAFVNTNTFNRCDQTLMDHFSQQMQSSFDKIFPTDVLLIQSHTVSNHGFTYVPRLFN